MELVHINNHNTSRVPKQYFFFIFSHKNRNGRKLTTKVPANVNRKSPPAVVVVVRARWACVLASVCARVRVSVCAYALRLSTSVVRINMWGGGDGGSGWRRRRWRFYGHCLLWHLDQVTRRWHMPSRGTSAAREPVCGCTYMDKSRRQCSLYIYNIILCASNLRRRR